MTLQCKCIYNNLRFHTRSSPSTQFRMAGSSKQCLGPLTLLQKYYTTELKLPDTSSWSDTLCKMFKRSKIHSFCCSWVRMIAISVFINVYLLKTCYWWKSSWYGILIAQINLLQVTPMKFLNCTLEDLVVISTVSIPMTQFNTMHSPVIEKLNFVFWSVKYWHTSMKSILCLFTTVDTDYMNLGDYKVENVEVRK